jgi:hypothetical protein
MVNNYAIGVGVVELIEDGVDEVVALLFIFSKIIEPITYPTAIVTAPTAMSKIWFFIIVFFSILICGDEHTFNDKANIERNF